jgi:hypothetical protein
VFSLPQLGCCRNEKADKPHAEMVKHNIREKNKAGTSENEGEVKCSVHRMEHAFYTRKEAKPRVSCGFFLRKNEKKGCFLCQQLLY